jgi:hypothetical protein
MADIRNPVDEDNPHRFAPAALDEEHVYGACSPGWHTAASHDEALADWLSFMQSRGVERVCCLLTGEQLDENGGNVRRYREAFGEHDVRHVPIPDYELADVATLESEVLPFLEAAVERGEKVVVHCLSGMGRTGQVLAAWLVYDRGYASERAIRAVKNAGRLPDEAIQAGNATEDDLVALLDRLR